MLTEVMMRYEVVYWEWTPDTEHLNFAVREMYRSQFHVYAYWVEAFPWLDLTAIQIHITIFQKIVKNVCSMQNVHF